LHTGNHAVTQDNTRTFSGIAGSIGLPNDKLASQEPSISFAPQYVELLSQAFLLTRGETWPGLSGLPRDKSRVRF
jgi:hypothetical protein